MSMSEFIARISVIALAGLVLASCASKPPPVPHYYVLDNLKQSSSKPSGKPLAVAEISVPDYLRQRKLVMRQSSQQILFANYHSWADDLPASMRRVLIDELSAASSIYRFVERCIDCGGLQIRVDQFYPTDTGQAVLSGSYSLQLKEKAGQGGEAQFQPFHLERALRDDGYDEAVFQMRQLLLDLSQVIVANDLKK